MRRWIALAARLYPRDWRARYGEEFDALVADATADWRQLLNVSRTAFAMQFARRVRALKIATAVALAGALLALAASYRVPPRYVSSATFRITPMIEANQSGLPSARPAPSDFFQRVTDDRFNMLKMDLTCRDTLLAILRHPSLNLYSEDREQLPLEDLAERMKDEGLQFDRQGTAVRISFAYRDRETAQAVVRLLASEMRDRNDVINREIGVNWKALWSTPIPFSERVEEVQPPILPAAPVEPRRSIFVAAGIAASLLLGALTLFVRSRPRLALRAVACGLLGAIVFAGASLLIPPRYTTKASLRLSAPFDPAHYSGRAPMTSLAQWLPVLEKQILNPDNLRRLLSNPKLAADRSGVLGMRMTDRDTLEISATYPDQSKARAMAVEIVSELQAHHGADQEEFDKHADEQVRFAHQHRAGEQLMIVSQAMPGEDSNVHYRILLTLAGAALGILFAAVRYRTSMNGESSFAFVGREA